DFAGGLLLQPGQNVRGRLQLTFRREEGKIFGDVVRADVVLKISVGTTGIGALHRLGLNDDVGESFIRPGGSFFEMLNQVASAGRAVWVQKSDFVKRPGEDRDNK